jgi:hypothetical protein
MILFALSTVKLSEAEISETSSTKASLKSPNAADVRSISASSGKPKRCHRCCSTHRQSLMTRPPWPLPESRPYSFVHDLDVAVTHVTRAAGVCIDRRDIGIPDVRYVNNVLPRIDCQRGCSLRAAKLVSAVGRGRVGDPGHVPASIREGTRVSITSPRWAQARRRGYRPQACTRCRRSLRGR